MLPDRDIISARELAAAAEVPLWAVQEAVVAGELRVHHPCDGWKLIERRDAERWMRNGRTRSSSREPERELEQARACGPKGRGQDDAQGHPRANAHQPRAVSR